MQGRVVRNEKLGFKQTKESQWKWIARSRAKKMMFLLRVLARKLGFLARSCAVLSGFETRSWVVWCFLAWTCWRQESEFQKAGEQDLAGFSIAAEENKSNDFVFELGVARSAQSGEVALPKGQHLKKTARLESKALWVAMGIENHRKIAKRDRPLLGSADGSSPRSNSQVTKM